MNIGYIGLGAMGGALARRLLGSHQLTVWDLHSAAVEAFANDGVGTAASAAELARRCSIILLCLPRSADVHQVIFGPDGLAEGLRVGSIVIDQSSGTPAETAQMGRHLAHRGVAMLDAPVSGNPKVFSSGGGTVMVSGTDDAYEKALPVLQALSDKVLRCGQRLGDAQAMKLVNNTINSGCRMATLETAALARKLGFALPWVIDTLDSGTAANSTTRVMLPALLESRPATNFALALMLKDLNQSLALGTRHNVPMPVAGLVRGMLQTGVNTLGEGARLEQLVQLAEAMAGTCIAAPSPPGPAAQANPELSEALRHTLAACNAVVTHEAFAMGVKFGLDFETLCTVINASSGWNGITQQWTAAQSPHHANITLGKMVQHLQRGFRMAEGVGAPMLMANAARGIFEAAARACGNAADSSAIARTYEDAAGLLSPWPQVSAPKACLELAIPPSAAASA